MTAPLEHALATVLRLAFGADTALLSLRPLAGDASSRRYYRAIVKGAAAPPSAIVMQLPAGTSLPLSSEELAVFKDAPKELPFLNVHRFLTSAGVRVPELYGYQERCGIVLLEDLGDTCLWDRVQGSTPAEIESWYQKAIDALLWLQVRGTNNRDPSCIAFQQRFDFRLYMWELDHFLEYGLEKRPGVAIQAAALAQLREVFTDLARRLERQPACLNHRDYHSWNLMIHNDAIVMIDFQDALLAPAQYDLASLLNDRETDRLITPDLEQRLLRYYLRKRDELAGIDTPEDEFSNVYLLSAIQRDLKVVGRFCYLDLVKGKPAYKKFVPPTLRRLKRNLARLPELKNIGLILAQHFEEIR